MDESENSSALNEKLICRLVWVLVALFWNSQVSCAADTQNSAFILGVHVHEPSRLRDLSRGFKAIRLWDSGVRWADLESSPGAFKFRRVDSYIDDSSSLGLAVVLTLGSTPEWASQRPSEPCSYGRGCAAPPHDFRDWRRYVEAVARRYKGRIGCYELWNEVRYHRGEDDFDPRGDPYFYSGTEVELIELARIAFEVVRSVDPAACLLTPSFHVYGDWFKKLSRYLDLGGARYADYISFHLVSTDISQTLSFARRVIEIMGLHGLSPAHLWNTEFDFDIQAAIEASGSVGPERGVVAALLQRLIVYKSVGVTKNFWYAYDNRKTGVYFDRKVGDRKFSAAVEDVVRWLQEYAVWGCRVDSGTKTWICDALRVGDGAPGYVIFGEKSPGHESCVIMPRGRDLLKTRVHSPWEGDTQVDLRRSCVIAGVTPAFIKLAE